MATQLARHGSDAGYRSEVKRGDVCTRCANAHRVYNRQFRAAGKAQGLKYGSYDVIDHLYTGGVKTKQAGPVRRQGGAGASTYPTHAAEPPVEPREEVPAGVSQPEPGEAGSGPSIGDRLGAKLREFVGSNPGNTYVESDEDTGYVHAIDDPDPEPASGEWAQVTDDEFVINAAGLKKIEDNLGTYVSIVGITVEMIDPYCGSIIADNIGPAVERWSKVIAHYPSAAKLFLDGKGGVIMQWISALQATWPILMAVYDHHLAKNVKVENGVLFRKVPTAQGPQFDATTPPMQGQTQYEYSAV